MPLGLGPSTPQTAFGISTQVVHVMEEEVDHVMEEEVDFHPDIVIDTDPAPEASIPYMILGPAYMV
ncbi:hypothetical protein FRC12_013691 [Ceratobasidium sp. 428]|nr:hypothetical protein FRC12_013691 [Ceratobasidium sp. 428]